MIPLEAEDDREESVEDQEQLASAEQEAPTKARFLRKLAIAVAGILLLLVLGSTGIYFSNTFGWFGPTTLRRDDSGNWDLRRFSGRPTEEREYIEQLIETWDSLRYMRLTWVDVERANSFPYGDYWKDMPSSRAQAALNSLQYSLGNLGESMQDLVTDYNELQRVSEPLLAARPELEETHEALRLSTDLEYEVTNPQVAYEFESLAEAIDAMFAALGITVPNPKIPEN